ncbi:VOC family protein [Paracoccaceae bacterium Fryx2]|nr:VOC family protein [Paracoccaceae bacterium Fryx2]
MKPVTSILETAIYAADIAAAAQFYRDVLGLTVVRQVDGSFVFLRCGRQMLLVFNPDAAARADPANPIPRHGAHGPGHVCFRAADADEVAAWRDHFVRLGLQVEHDHLWPDGARSVYIRDPAGNSVEVGEARMWGLD